MSLRYPKKCGTCKKYMSKKLCPLEADGYNPSYNSKACSEYKLDDLFVNAHKWRKWKQSELWENDSGGKI